MHLAPRRRRSPFFLIASLLLATAAGNAAAECLLEPAADDYAIIAATAPANPLGFMLHGSNHEAGRVDVLVGATEKPVVLLLLDGDAVVWVLQRTEQARIAGVVLVDGTMPSTLLGLPAGVPLLRTGSKTNGDCTRINSHARSPAELDEIARKLAGHGLDRVVNGEPGRVTIGDVTGAGTKPAGPGDAEVAALCDPAQPLAGSAFVEDAVKRGLLRPAYTADLAVFEQARRLAGDRARIARDEPPLANPAPDRFQALQGRGTVLDRSYVVLGDLVLPTGTHRSRYTLYVPDAVRVDKNRSHLAANVLPQAGVGCDASGCKPVAPSTASPSPATPPVERPGPGGRTPPVSPECALPASPGPGPFRVFAVSGSGAWPAGFALPGTREEAYKVDVIVNLPGTPVILMLGEYETRIWSISWTPGTVIAAVWASGYHPQEVIGLPKSTPLLTSFFQAGETRCPHFRVIKGEIGTLNPLSRAVFGQPIEAWYETRGGGVYLGGRPAAGTPLLSGKGRRLDDLRDPDHPYAGIALLQDLERRGIIRPANHGELKQFTESAQQARKKDRQGPALERQGKPFFDGPEFPPGQRAALTYIVLRDLRIDGLKDLFRHRLLVPHGVELTGDTAEAHGISVLRAGNLECDQRTCTAR